MVLVCDDFTALLCVFFSSRGVTSHFACMSFTAKLEQHVALFRQILVIPRPFTKKVAQKYLIPIIVIDLFVYVPGVGVAVANAEVAQPVEG